MAWQLIGLPVWRCEVANPLLPGSGSVEPRPGVIRLYEEAREAGLKVAVCSAATKSSVILVLENLLGPERFEVLACSSTSILAQLHFSRPCCEKWSSLSSLPAWVFSAS